MGVLTRTWSVVVTVERDDAPLTLESVKAQCRVSADVTDDDDLLEDYRLTAADVVEDLAEVALGVQTRVMTANAFPDDYELLVLPFPPVRAVTSVQYRDPAGVLQTWDQAEYDLVTSGRFGTIVPKVGHCYPRTRWNAPDAVVVTFTCGYAAGAVPRRYLQAMRQLVAYWYADPEAGSTSALPENFDAGPPARLQACC